jgi:hypothetical protein
VTQSGFPADALIAVLQAMEQAINKANLAILGFHCVLGAVGGVMADGLWYALEVLVQSLQNHSGVTKTHLQCYRWKPLGGFGCGWK